MGLPPDRCTAAPEAQTGRAGRGSAPGAAAPAARSNDTRSPCPRRSRLCARPGRTSGAASRSARRWRARPAPVRAWAGAPRPCRWGRGGPYNAASRRRRVISRIGSGSPASRARSGREAKLLLATTTSRRPGSQRRSCNSSMAGGHVAQHEERSPHAGLAQQIEHLRRTVHDPVLIGGPRRVVEDHALIPIFHVNGQRIYHSEPHGCRLIAIGPSL